MSTLKRHRVCLLGGGIFARTAHLPAILKTEEFELVAVWSRSGNSASSIQKEAVKLGYRDHVLETYYEDHGGSHNLAALLARDDIHTCIMALPIPNQPEIIQKAWEAGKNVISEKPIAKDVALATQLVQLFEQTYAPRGLQWFIAEQVPYEPGYNAARQVIGSGALGDLRSFSMDWFHYMPPDQPYNLTEWRQKPAYQGGYLLDGGVHNAAGLRYMLSAYKNTEMTAVSSTTSLHHQHLWPLDTMQGLIQTSCKVAGNFNLSVAQEQRSPPTYTFRGSRAILTLKMSFRDGKMSWTVETVNNEGKDLIKEELPGNGVECEMQAFARAIIAGPNSSEAQEVMAKTGPRAALQDVLFIEAALKSGETGQWKALKHVQADA